MTLVISGFGVGFLVAVALASFLQTGILRVLLVAVAIIISIGATIYVIAFGSCPDRGCNSGMTIASFAAGLAGWTIGVASSWLVRLPLQR
jgi:hypothetical protein